MVDLLGKLLHNSGKNEYREGFAPLDPVDWPEEWKTTYYKEYTRFPSIALKKPDADDQLRMLLADRRSKREFSASGVSLDELSVLLKYGAGEFLHTDNEVHRTYPSGGARYPTELYVILRESRDEQLKPGVYHYNVKKNSLEFLWEERESKINPSLLVMDTWAEKASAIIVITSVFWRSQNKYENRAYRLLCIEIGAVIQNLYLLAETLGLPHVSYSGTNDDKIEELLALDVETESLIMSFLVG